MVLCSSSSKSRKELESDISSLRHTIAAKESEISSQAFVNETLQEELTQADARYTQQRETWQSERDQLRNALEDLQRRHGEELAEYKIRVVRYEERVAFVENERDAANSLLRETQERSETEIHELEQELTRLQGELEKAKKPQYVNAQQSRNGNRAPHYDDCTPPSSPKSGVPQIRVGTSAASSSSGSMNTTNHGGAGPEPGNAEKDDTTPSSSSTSGVTTKVRAFETVDKAKKQAESWKAAHATVQKQLNDVQMELKNVKKAKATAEAELASVREQLAKSATEHGAELSLLRGHEEERKAELEAVGQRLEKMAYQKEVYRAKLQALHSQNQALHLSLQQAHKALDAFHETSGVRAARGVGGAGGIVVGAGGGTSNGASIEAAGEEDSRSQPWPSGTDLQQHRGTVEAQFQGGGGGGSSSSSSSGGVKQGHLVQEDEQGGIKPIGDGEPSATSADQAASASVSRGHELLERGPRLAQSSSTTNSRAHSKQESISSCEFPDHHAATPLDIAQLQPLAGPRGAHSSAHLPVQEYSSSQLHQPQQLDHQLQHDHDVEHRISDVAMRVIDQALKTKSQVRHADHRTGEHLMRKEQQQPLDETGGGGLRNSHGAGFRNTRFWKPNYGTTPSASK
ncbi:unnamed protein product [Amoebophrya sp. A25]|nr:unnamed protein product [Amoebophrya sp. A25]|eukprot:GSA25T00003250001.1